MRDTNNNSKRRGGKRKAPEEAETTVVSQELTLNSSKASKKSKIVVNTLDLSVLDGVGAGTLYTFGTGDCGQLGLGENVKKRNYPSLVETLKGKKIVKVACGGMHTAVLDADGKVWTFGLNDDSALGRKTEEEEENFEAGEVDLKRNRAVQISAGDSHTAALTENGIVYAWGTFKDMNGNFGLIPGNEKKCWLEPQLISGPVGAKVTKIASGDNHLVMLTEDGKVFTCGTGEQGQLGREVNLGEDRRVTRARAKSSAAVPARDVLLTPTEVKIPRKKFKNIWCGSFSTYCLTERNNEVWVFGLNNYRQLGIDREDLIRVPAKSTGFKGMKVSSIAAGQHHAVALDEEGKIYTLGRASDGRLGLGPDSREFVPAPAEVLGLSRQKSVLITAGLSTAYSITNDGKIYAWGFGGNYQLGTGKTDDEDVPRVMDFMVRDSKKVELDVNAVNISAGGQHVAVTLKQTN